MAPRAFVVEFAFAATAPLMPTLAMFANQAVARPPVGLVAGPTEVEWAGGPFGCDAHCVAEPLRNRVRARKIPARPARDDRQLHALASGDAVYDLVDGPVASDHDEQEAPSSAASRASSPSWPARSEKIASPRRPAA